MDVGYVGLGKLAMPVAVAVSLKGHRVFAYDSAPRIYDAYRKGIWPYQEAGYEPGESFSDSMQRSHITLCESIEEVVANSEIIFVAVQTPHGPEYEGITRLPLERADFDYTYLQVAISELARYIHDKSRVVAIISTVLPGTIAREIQPIAGPNMRLAFNPSFIAMSTVIQDYLHPEIVLVGSGDEKAISRLTEFYATITETPVFATNIVTAEVIKVCYNTYVTSKIVLANTIMELCEKVGGNCDTVTRALHLSTKRIVSGKYMWGGMGDSGGCHPRDAIALAHLARRVNLSYSIYDSLMVARERQAEWLCSLVMEYPGLPKVILGTAFKAGTNIETGSAAILCRNILQECGERVDTYDPVVEGPLLPDNEKWGHIFGGPKCYLIGTNHPDFPRYTFPIGSIVIDPWGYIPDREGVRVRRVGRY